MPRLTQKLIDATEPGVREITLRDETLRGFHVRIYPGGTKTYWLHYRTHGRIERRVKIARCDEMTPTKARDIARDLMEVVRKGGDPAAERKAARLDYQQSLDAKTKQPASGSTLTDQNLVLECLHGLRNEIRELRREMQNGFREIHELQERIETIETRLGISCLGGVPHG